VIPRFALCARAIGIAAIGLFMTLGLTGCAGFEAAPGTYRSELGRAGSMQTLRSTIEREIRSYGFQIQQSNPRMMYTDWRVRSSSDVGLQKSGIRRVRDRVEINYRQRGTAYHYATMRANFEVNQAGTWVSSELPPQLQDQYEQLEARISDELQEYMTQ